MIQRIVHSYLSPSETLEACSKNLIVLRDLMEGNIADDATDTVIKNINVDGTLNATDIALTSTLHIVPTSAAATDNTYYASGNISNIMRGIKHSLPFAEGNVHLYNNLERILHALESIGFQSTP